MIKGKHVWDKASIKSVEIRNEMDRRKEGKTTYARDSIGGCCCRIYYKHYSETYESVHDIMNEQSFVRRVESEGYVTNPHYTSNYDSYKNEFT